MLYTPTEYVNYKNTKSLWYEWDFIGERLETWVGMIYVNKDSKKFGFKQSNNDKLDVYILLESFGIFSKVGEIFSWDLHELNYDRVLQMLENIKKDVKSYKASTSEFITCEMSYRKNVINASDVGNYNLRVA